ncbi:hypothetical protein [Psychromonas aquatilis]|uniref:Uncharacterized protein n=1 Tax=Psychromonas aquatilis TaxID=2005072 RepID=A0ABU9GTN1_9GAMM
MYESERKNPNGYDVNESCAAISHYQEIALKIEAKTAESYLKVLTEKIHYARDHCAYPGEYNGGKASYGSVHNRVEDWYQNELIYYSQIKLMRLAFYHRFMA